MARLSIEQRIKIVEIFITTKSIVATQREFKKQLKLKKAPSGKAIREVVAKFQSTGSVKDQHRGASGRPRSVRNRDNIEKLEASFEEDPAMSNRKRAQAVDINPTSVWRIARNDLKLKAYKIQDVQILSAEDKIKRLEMCKKFDQEMSKNSNWISNVWFSDEAHFYLECGMNSQNSRIWATTKPDSVNQRPLHSAKCTAWCAMSASGIIGPFWFEDEESGNTVTVNQERYREMIKKFETALSTRSGLQAEVQWLMQDGATPHTANATMSALQESFGDRIISKKSTFQWAPRSPDLNPLDFYFWGYCKANVYRNKPNTVGMLKTEIENFIASIPTEMCQRAIKNFEKRVEFCIQHQGGHFEHNFK